MYKAVIIDDEPIIVKGLSSLIPWGKYDCEVAGTASDGQSGLELVREVQPDLIFTDIYMPKMDGLVMIAALRSEFENVELTVLTGYRDFELIQKALHLGVTRFLLKPSNMEELEEAVAAMTERLRRKDVLPEHKTTGESVQGEKGKVEGKAEAAQSRTGEGALEAGNFLVRTALEYIRKNYARKLTLTDVADHVYVSQWHLSKLINRELNMNFSELLGGIRVDAAKELMKDPSLRLGDISDMVGFQDVAHFSRVFKRVTGVSANQYRNSLL